MLSLIAISVDISSSRTSKIAAATDGRVLVHVLVDSDEVTTDNSTSTWFVLLNSYAIRVTYHFCHILNEKTSNAK